MTSAIDSAFVADHEAKIEALRVRVAGLEGRREHKKERSMMNKEIYRMENDLNCVHPGEQRMTYPHATSSLTQSADLCLIRMARTPLV